LVSSAINKVSRYPITNLIYEDPSEKVREHWEWFFTRILKLKDRQMECNLDLNVYGNCFVSLAFPFTRFLICRECKHPTDIKTVNWRWVSFTFAYTCPHCKKAVSCDYRSGEVKDVPVRNPEGIKIIRWNPENILVKYNEATASSFYSYLVPYTTRYMIMQADRDLLMEIPLLFLEAFRKQRLIRLSTANLFHMKRPTLAEKDLGYGKPLILHVLKDLYYLFTLRRGQEAIANEHIAPLDILFPTTNADINPYAHIDLGSWRRHVQTIIENHRSDLNFKGISPVPLGTERIGGDGRALLITPELQYLNQTIIGGMGIPQEFLFGNLSFSGSSLTLRSLSNDFQHNQSQLLDLTTWIKDKVRIFMNWPDIKNLRFTDFKMADDVQKIQQLIALNSQNKVSDKTLLTEIGIDSDEENKLIAQEMEVRNKLQEIAAKGQAKIAGEAQLISYQYQQKLAEMQMEDQLQQQMKLEQQQAQGGQPGMSQLEQAAASPAGGIPGGPAETEALGTPMANEYGVQPTASQPGKPDPSQVQAEQSAPPGALGHSPEESSRIRAEGGAPEQPSEAAEPNAQLAQQVTRWASKLVQLPINEAMTNLVTIREQFPSLAGAIEKKYNELKAQTPAAGNFGGNLANPATTGKVNMGTPTGRGTPRTGG
jgi:hypothetical protein